MIVSLDRIEERFFATGDGLEAVRRRSDAVDEAVLHLFAAVFGHPPTPGVSLLAVGGYGRRQLFPYSDVDLLFLLEKPAAAAAAREKISALLRDLWDSGLRASHSVRTPPECASLDSGNAELAVSLLDLRCLAGDQTLYARLFERLPAFYLRERDSLLRHLARLTRARHARYGDTIYHLEPNIKDAPGGLRDFHVTCWLAKLAHAAPGASAEQFLPPESRSDLLETQRFLFALRCYLHYFNGRDNNILTFEHQERVAAEAGGKCFAGSGDPAAWMRLYFRHARLIHRLAARLMEETATPQHSLFTLFRDRQSRLSNADFAVTRGLLYLRRPDVLEIEPAPLLRLFEFIARHGVPAAPETERRIATAVPAFSSHLRQARRFELSLWPSLASILRLPHAYQALLAMRETGLLGAFFPEFEPLDCLVIRDFYHRYTVDEHSLRTIKILHELAKAADPVTRRFAELLEETGQSELLLFALLLHDVGKGAGVDNHISAGLELAERAMDRLQIAEQDKETVRFLIRHHLDLSAVMTTRDLADPATARFLASQVSTLERLRQLTLMTYADIAAVSPDSLTPWRQDLLWQLYVAAHNQLTREMEADRIEAAAAPLADQLPLSDAERQALSRFLHGLPTRYLRTHTPQQVAQHFRLHETFRRKGVAVSLAKRHSLYELLVLAADRPFLFASIAGTVASFAMNILQAEAFSNSSGMVLDTLVFADPGRSLELNPAEAARLCSTLEAVLLGKISVRELLQKRPSPKPLRRPRVPLQVSSDNHTSAHDTIFHVITEDRPRLLYDLAGAFSFNQCDIDLVLIDTQGSKAVDVFYVRSGGEKLDPERARRICLELEAACAGEP